mmetsp:Transcript_12871/g.36174  ORF Transcript_12871/g.36174 Transcript_12871/m.36174 type:complete len:368 (+) Transcript_12871:1043-2146(+)
MLEERRPGRQGCAPHEASCPNECQVPLWRCDCARQEGAAGRQDDVRVKPACELGREAANLLKLHSAGAHPVHKKVCTAPQRRRSATSRRNGIPLLHKPVAKMVRQDGRRSAGPVQVRVAQSVQGPKVQHLQHQQRRQPPQQGTRATVASLLLLFLCEGRWWVHGLGAELLDSSAQDDAERGSGAEARAPHAEEGDPMEVAWVLSHKLGESQSQLFPAVFLESASPLPRNPLQLIPSPLICGALLSGSALCTAVLCCTGACLLKGPEQRLHHLADLLRVGQHLQHSLRRCRPHPVFQRPQPDNQWLQCHRPWQLGQRLGRAAADTNVCIAKQPHQMLDKAAPIPRGWSCLCCEGRDQGEAASLCRGLG